LNWLELRGVFHNTSNINKLKFHENNVWLWFKGENNPTIYYNVTYSERNLIRKLINNDIRTDSR